MTRHLWESAPPEKRGGLRPVCAVSPGVLGITGIETKEIVAGIVQRIKPDFVLVIDALASRSTERVGSTVQIANTGINPGSGVGNHRLGLTTESLGVPVIAIGVPTVVHARTIIHDALEQMAGLGGPSTNAYRKGSLTGSLPLFPGFDCDPKEIDVLIKTFGRWRGNQYCFASGVTAEEVFRYLE